MCICKGATITDLGIEFSTKKAAREAFRGEEEVSSCLRFVVFASARSRAFCSTSYTFASARSKIKNFSAHGGNKKNGPPLKFTNLFIP